VGKKTAHLTTKRKTTMKTHQTKTLLALSLLVLTACSTTQKADINQSSLNCAFLANDCAKLTAGGKDQAGLRYINPAAQWTQYNKVLIAPVSFWGGDSTTIPAADQQALVDYFTQQLNSELGKKFEVVTQSGAGVMKIEVAMVDAAAATPVLRTVSMIVPQAHMIANLKYLATGTFPFVGAAQAETKVTDATTGQVLALAADKRIGGGSMAAGFQWKWGDAENAITHWSELAATRLSAWTSGTPAQ
jgi:hypothetical protein